MVENKPDQFAADLEKFGVPQDEIEKAKKVLQSTSPNSVDAQGFALWPEHVAPLMAFEASITQWRMRSGGMGPSSYMGLDYSAVKVVLEGRDLKLDARGWRDFAVLEDEAVECLNERLSQQ